jgi:hypothetical protein
MSYYRLGRTVITDHAGTPREEVLFTTSRELLERELDASLRRGSFAEDSLDAAWFFTITHDSNELESYLPMTLWIGGGSGRELFPDFSVTRGDLRVEVEVDHGGPVSFRVGTRTFPSLSALGDSDLVPPLRETSGEVQVQISTEGLLASIPQLEPPLRESLFRFMPFFQSEDFRERWEEERELLDLGVDQFDGHIPFDTWFDLRQLETLCDDVGVDPEIA